MLRRAARPGGRGKIAMVGLRRVGARVGNSMLSCDEERFSRAFRISKFMDCNAKNIWRRK